jgi:hypothetical protein
MTSFLTTIFTLNRFGWALLASVIAHLCLLFWLPSSIKLNQLPPNPKRISLVKVISLPPTLKPTKLATGLEIEVEKDLNPNLTEENLNSDAPEPLAPALKQSLSVAPLPNQRPLTTLDTNVKLPKLAMDQPKNEEQKTESPDTTAGIAQKTASNLAQKSAGQTKRTPKITPEPTTELLKKPKQSVPTPTKKIIATPIPDQPEPTEKKPTEKPANTPFTSTLARIYQEYGADNLIPRLIAPKDALIDPDKREPGIEWIKPATNSNQIGTVTIVLIVAPDGTVEQELINDNDPTELREIALQTVKGYYQKFSPIESKWKGKYRLVTIRFEFIDFAG